MNIVEILTTTIKAKLMPVLNKLKLLTNKSFIKNKLLVRIRNFFSGCWISDRGVNGITILF